MINKYFTLAIRNVNKKKLYSFINVFGLAIGVAICLMISAYVDFELSYDRHHTNGSNIYRTILTRYQNGEFRDAIPFTGYGTGPALLADIPEIKQVARMHPFFGGAILNSADNKNPVQFREEGAYFVDPSFLEMFTFKVLAGDLKTALNEPNNIVITTSLAKKYFSNEHVVGKTLKLTGAWYNQDFTISAVVDDQPENSSIAFDFLLPIRDLLKQQQYLEDDGWGWKNFMTYIEVQPNADIKALTSKMPGFISKYVIGKQDVTFQSLYDVHTQTGLTFDSKDRISRGKIYFFILISVFILCIAWVNYINLTTARSIERAREVGIKKVVGAHKIQLVMQFLLESAIINIFAVVLALLMAIALLPYFEQIVDKHFGVNFYDVRLWLFLGGLAIFGSLVSGIYPALILSSFKITTVLKGGAEKITNTFSLRKALVVFQFACSLTLICIAFVVHRQIGFMEKLVSRLNMDQILIVKAPYIIEQESAEQRLLTFKQQIQNLSSVKSACSSGGIPGGGYSFSTTMRKRGDALENQKGAHVINVDPDFIETYNIQIVAGKRWDPNAYSSEDKSLIINETALSTFGIKNADEALNNHIIFENDTFSIAGVMKDFHWNSLKSASVPIVFRSVKILQHTFSIRLNTNDYKASISQIRSLFREAFPGNPLEYYFLDDFFNQQYKDDQSFGKVFGSFAIFAVLISCLGLLGLTAFTTDKKQKEISIRKVLGATNGKIISMLSKDFLRLVLLASLFSIPIMWFLTERWLNTFAFRMTLSWDVFVVPIAILTFVCMITIVANIWRGANVNPARVLKSE